MCSTTKLPYFPTSLTILSPMDENSAQQCQSFLDAGPFLTSEKRSKFSAAQKHQSTHISDFGRIWGKAQGSWLSAPAWVPLTLPCMFTVAWSCQFYLSSLLCEHLYHILPMATTETTSPTSHSLQITSTAPPQPHQYYPMATNYMPCWIPRTVPSLGHFPGSTLSSR